MIEENKPPNVETRHPKKDAAAAQILTADEKTVQIKKGEMLNVLPDVDAAPGETALRDMFRSPAFNCCDGLDDYDQNYNAFHVIENVVTADMRHQMERVKENRAVEPIRTHPAVDVSHAEFEAASKAGLSGQRLYTRSETIEDRNAAVPLKLNSNGRVMIIGPEDRVIECARSMGAPLYGILMITSDGNAAEEYIVEPNTIGQWSVIYCDVIKISGYLGQFRVTATRYCQRNLESSFEDFEAFDADLILDLDSPPHMSCQRAPVGYFATGGSDTALSRAMEELPALVGKFEKPQIISQTLRICAHIRSGLTGCSRCIEACPCGAVVTNGEKIKIDHYLCQGCGLCVAICPSGAMTNAYFNAGDLLTDLKQTLRTQMPGNNPAPWVVFHEPETDTESLSVLRRQTADSIVLRQVDDIASIGPDISLAALAYGAARVITLMSSQTTDGMRQTINTQLKYIDDILKGLKGFAGRIVSGETSSLKNTTEVAFVRMDDPITSGPNESATFSPYQSKRALIRQSVEHLFVQCPGSPAFVSLSEGAPFGEVRISKRNCTLCLACAHVCPTGALTGGADQPQLNFIEADCIQCDLCKQACPEAAIALNPRFVYDRRTAERSRVLHQEIPFACIQCGKPIAALKMIEQIKTKLKNHWMYADSRDIRRLEMCKDCRIADCFRQN